jgi:TonB family protein
MFRSRGVAKLFVAIALLTSTLSVAVRGVPAQRAELERLRAELKSRTRSIQDQFAKLRQPKPPQFAERRGLINAPSPAGANLPPDEFPNYDRPYTQSGGSAPRDRESLRQWQDELARRFSRAADTVERMLQLNPPDARELTETLETLRLYAQPAGGPDSWRTVFGASEVQTRARLTSTPEALVGKASGQVRLRLVLAADGSVKDIFPIQPAGRGLTESAVEAARRITFEPAVKNGAPVSQFVTLVYNFKGGNPAKPYVSITVF